MKFKLKQKQKALHKSSGCYVFAFVLLALLMVWACFSFELSLPLVGFFGDPPVAQATPAKSYTVTPTQSADSRR